MIKYLELHKVLGIRATSDATIRRPNGRVYQRLSADAKATVPDTASPLSIATHEVEFDGKCATDSRLGTTQLEAYWDPATGAVGDRKSKSHMDKINPAQPADHAILIFLDKEAGLVGRGVGSKVLRHSGTYYFMLTWSDFFGHSIAESELRAGGKNRTIYLREVPAEAAELLHRELLNHPNIA